jgi:hypothetical protein
MRKRRLNSFHTRTISRNIFLRKPNAIKLTELDKGYNYFANHTIHVKSIHLIPFSKFKNKSKISKIN